MSYLKSEIIAIETKRKQSIKQFFLANQQLQFVISIFFFVGFAVTLAPVGWQTGLSRLVVTAGIA